MAVARERVRVFVVVLIRVQIRVRIIPGRGSLREVTWGSWSYPVRRLSQSCQVHRGDPKHELERAVPSA